MGSVWQAGRFVLARLLDVYRLGLALFVRGPWIVLVASVPELVQHAVEIHIGMFASHEAARALARDDRRLIVGVFKVLGLVVAMLGTARFWWTRDTGGALLRMGWPSLRTLLVCVGLSYAIPELASLTGALLPARGLDALRWALSLGTLPLLFVALGALFEDTGATWPHAYRRCWRWAPLLLLLSGAGFVPTMALHHLVHRWALGRAPLILWMMMTADALLVGLMASLVGAALYLGYAAFRPPDPGRA